MHRPRIISGACRAGLLAGAMAAVLHLRADGYWAAGLTEIAWTTAARDLAAFGLLAALSMVIPLALVRGRPSALAVALVEGLVVFVVATGMWIWPSRATPSLDSTGGQVVSAAILGLAIGTALLGGLAGGGRGLAARWLFQRLPVVGFVVALAMGGIAHLRVASLETDRPPVVMISLDTLRADRVGCYGYERDTTPHLDAFAARAVRFEKVITPYPWTLLSHASMLTGVYPSVHGANYTEPVHEELRTVVHAFRDAGYVTVGLTDGCKWLDREFGYLDGFQVYRQMWTSIEEKNDRLEELLADIGRRPLFLFLHYFDIHSDRDLPYEAPAPFGGKYSSWYQKDFFAPRGERGPAMREWQKDKEEIDLAPEDLRYISDLYDEGVAYTDSQIRRTLDLLRAGLDYEAASILITSDHGEEFCEHGRFRHVQYYDECVRVPLLLKLPQAAHAGRVVAEPAAVLDIAPTLAEAGGLTLQGPQQGMSLFRYWDANPPPQRVIFLDGHEVGPLSVVDWPWKLICRTDSELYHLELDPAEQVNRAADEPAHVARLQALVDEQSGRNEDLLRNLGERQGETVEMSDEEREILEGIGYVEDS